MCALLTPVPPQRHYTHAEQNMFKSVSACTAFLTDLSAWLRHRPGSSVEAAPHGCLALKLHSMGNYLTLKALERIHLKGGRAAVTTLLARLVLDAPDVPTYFFDELLSAALAETPTLHLWSAGDHAVEGSRVRRGLDAGYPGNSTAGPAVVAACPLLESVDASAAKASNRMGHDYGSTCGYALRDQRAFLDGVPPADRLLGRAGAGGWVMKR